MLPEAVCDHGGGCGAAEAGLAEADDAVAAGIRERAREYREALEAEFPGDLERGALTDDPEWRQWFFDRWKGPACPVLDPEWRTCLFEKTPSGGVPAVWSADPDRRRTSGPCGLCYEGVPGDELESYAVEVRGGWDVERGGAETIVALAVAAPTEGGG
jgi:hypothetical protein